MFRIRTPGLRVRVRFSGFQDAKNKSQYYRNLNFSEFLLLMEGSESGSVQITDPGVPKSEGSQDSGCETLLEG